MCQDQVLFCHAIWPKTTWLSWIWQQWKTGLSWTRHSSRSWSATWIGSASQSAFKTNWSRTLPWQLSKSNWWRSTRSCLFYFPTSLTLQGWWCAKSSQTTNMLRSKASAFISISKTKSLKMLCLFWRMKETCIQSFYVLRSFSQARNHKKHWSTLLRTLTRHLWPVLATPTCFWRVPSLLSLDLHRCRLW